MFIPAKPVYRVVSCLVLIFAMQNWVQAQTYYVDQKHPNANDKNSGSAEQPWSSLFPTTRKNFAPGDTIIVHAGVYTSWPGSGNAALIDPKTSGRNDSPISFISTPRHAAVLDGRSASEAMVHIRSRSNIVIDGFKISQPGTSGIVVEGEAQQPSYGVVIKNNSVSAVRNQFAAENTDGIRLQYTANARVLNNKINDVRDGALSPNAAGIKVINSEKAVLSNNDVTNATTGIFIRENARNINVQSNFISNAEYAIKASNSNRTSIRYLNIYENIIENSELAIQLLPEGGTIDSITVANNVFHDYSIGAIQSTQPGMGKVQIYNNIFNRSSTSGEFVADVYTYDDPPLSLQNMDYNLFTQQPMIINGLYSTNRLSGSLSTWSAYAEHDKHSIVGPARFRDAKANNFRLKSGSMAENNGREGGASSARKINIGAYQSDNNVVGYRRSGRYIPEKSTVASSRPSMKSSQPMTKSKTIKPSTKPKVATKTAKPKASASSKAEVPVKSKTQSSVKPEIKPTPAKEKTDKKEITVASMYPDAKPRKINGLTQLEWDVRNALRFDGACVLESKKIYFYDGYSDTGLKLRILNDSLYFLTKSNIDISYKDVGMQVGSNDFIHADEVVNEQSVVIKKELPKLLDQIRTGSVAKVQLRFWPTYPATRTYSEQIALDGFLEAYNQYKACKGK